jgi:1-deoxy-D-xylulose-5-phosphate reductoisomerase
MLRRVAILGSTGSIGRQALQVITAHPDRLAVAALAAGSNIDLLTQQANLLQPRLVSIASADAASTLSSHLTYKPEQICHGEEGLVAVACASGADIVLAATDGMVALRAVFESLSRGLHVALANKELLVAAGRILCALARSSGALIVPVDSEHSALFQCLMGERADNVASIVVTASGGPFWDWSLAQMEAASPEQALRHPIWRMGAKNTIDSATLMNKGLEVIEASLLFGFAPAQIEVVVHRQSVVHGFVVFRDGSVKAQLSAPDMRLPIGFALAYPERLPTAVAQLDTKAAIGLGGAAATLSFEPVDKARFPAVGLAYRALELGGTYPAVLSAANEEAGRAFLQRQIKFTEICPIVQGAMSAHVARGDALEDVRAADEFGRTYARNAVRAAVQR